MKKKVGKRRDIASWQFMNILGMHYVQVYQNT